MHAIEIVTLIINIVSLSICGGLVFSLLASTRRDEFSQLFAAVCASFALWVSMALVRSLSLSLDIQDIVLVQINLNLLMSARLLSGALYFVFMIRYTGIRSKMLDAMSGVIGVVTVLGIILIWVGQLFTVDSQYVPQFAVNEIGFVVVGIVIGYMLVAFWLMLNATSDQSSLLLRPTLILFLAYVVASFDIWTVIFSLDILLVSIAVGWIGYRMLRRQAVNPQVALNRDLQLTNTELQRTIHDLAQEKEKTEALNIELIQANRYKDEFLATMSHELRTPLNSIVGYSELLMTNMYGELGQKQFDRLERIHRNGRQLTAVINAILDLNKIDSGRLQLVVEDFSLIDLIREVADEFKPEAESTNVEFIIDLPDSTPLYHGDKQRIAQVLRIVLDNAFKFTEQGHVKVTLTDTIVKQGKSESYSLPTLGWLKDGHWAVIELIDTGTGIAPEDQARIFDRFSQVDSSRTREYDGIGLGLTIARKLVELHDGLIWVKSYVDKGSTFHVALPIQSSLRNGTKHK